LLCFQEIQVISSRNSAEEVDLSFTEIRNRDKGTPPDFESFFLEKRP